MPTVRIRNLGAVGIVNDVAPENLPPNGFSAGVNVRFDERGVGRAAIMREGINLSPILNPKAVIAVEGTGAADYDRILVVGSSLNVYDVTSGEVGEQLDPASVYPSNDSPVTVQKFLGSVIFNRSDTYPTILGPGLTTLDDLPFWPTGMRCRSLRKFGENLVAVSLLGDFGENVSAKLRSIRLSSFARGAIPQSWDITDPESGATEIAFDIEEPLRDAAELGNQLICYSDREAVVVRRTGGTLLYTTQRLPGYRGIFGMDCVTEVADAHVCFGPEDIVIHTPASAPASILDGANKRFIYEYLDWEATSEFFVQRVDRFSEVWFCYRTSWEGARWRNSKKGCNFAAVWNWASKTWSFVDLPCVTSACITNLEVTVPSWDDYGSVTWDSVGGTWQTEYTAQRRFPLFTSCQYAGEGGNNALSVARILVLDGQDQQSSCNLPVCAEAYCTAWVERSGLDLDIEQNFPLDAYKHVRHLYPQGEVRDDLLFLSLGGSFAPRQYRQLTETQTIRVSTDYRCDTKTGGRYIAYRLTSEDRGDWALSGFDMELALLGRR